MLCLGHEIYEIFSIWKNSLKNNIDSEMVKGKGG